MLQILADFHITEKVTIKTDVTQKLSRILSNRCTMEIKNESKQVKNIFFYIILLYSIQSLFLVASCDGSK